MKVLIVSSGEIDDLKIVEEEVKKSDYIVCADGGLDYLRKINSLPDIILGDLDSITEQGRSYIEDNKIRLIKYPSMKNMTDTELAIDFVVKKKTIEEIIFLGVTGSRIDHSLINIFALRDLYKKKIKAKIRDGNNFIYYTESDLKLRKRDDYYVSIIPLSDDGIEVTLNGFLYPLNKFNMPFASSRGISNEIREEEAQIRIHKGSCLVVESRDKEIIL